MIKMPYFKAHKDAYSGLNEKYISVDTIYKVIDFDFTNDGFEYAINDDLGAELWFSDTDLDFNYKDYFQKVKIKVV